MSESETNRCLCQQISTKVFKLWSSDDKYYKSSFNYPNNHLIYRFIYVLLILFIYCAITSEATRPTYLLFANRKDIRLLNGDTQRANASIIISHLEEAAALDYYFKESIIFWADIGLEMIKGIKINGTLSPDKAFTIIQSGIISPDGLATDWLTKKLYWTDSETNRIEVSRFDGSDRKVLFWKDLDQPRAIALAPNDGLMFWTDWGEMPKIEKSSMDGDPITRTIIVKDNIYWPNGLTIDYEKKRLFWADAKLKFISSMDFSGSNRKNVINGHLSHPFALTLLGDTIYWTDWSTRAIHSFNRVTEQRKKIISGQLSPMDIHVYSASRQLHSDTACDKDNGGCSNLCLLSSISPFYSCGCPTGVRLLPDLKTCATSAEEILLLARRVDIRRISLDTADHTDVVLPLRNIKHAIAVDFDPIDKKIYWTDDDVHVIRRAFLNGSQQEDIVSTEVHHPDGIAIDWIARNIYWTDTGTDRIEVARLNGTARKIILTEGLDEPRAIVVHPIEGLIFWTDWGSKAKIERAALDGSQRAVVINTGLGWPNGLAIDYDLMKIYWSDAKTDKIEKSNFDGSERSTIVSEQLPHVFGFTLLNDWVYWSDWQRRSVERVNKITGEQRETIVDQLPDLMGLKAVAVNRVLGTNPCAINNGNCSHLCLYKPKKRFVCACPMGYELATDSHTCIVPEAFLLFSRRVGIHRISLESHHLDLIPIAGIQETTSFDYDLNDNRIYWTDVKSKSLSRSFMNGSNIEHIIEFGLEYPDGIAVDWVSRNLYWADTESNKIEVSRLDGTHRKVLIWKDLDNPKSIALSPSEGLMFWSDWASIQRIERSALDGSHRMIIVNNAGRANSLTIDYNERRLYWVDIDSNKIMSSALDGSNRNILFKDHLTKPHGLTLYQDFIYWSDWETNTIERADKSYGLNRTVISTQLDYVIDLVIYHNSRQSGWNPCAVNNGGCEQLCLALPGNNQRAYTHNCVCSSHYRLNLDNKTCSAPQKFLLYSQRNTITRLVMDSVTDAPDITLPIDNLKNVKALAYDPFEQLIYWIEGRTLSIKKAYMNGTGISVVVPNPHDINGPFDLELDPYSRLIYWSCSQTNSINITRLDGRNIGTLLTDSLDRPRALSLHYKKGYLFWVNAISPPKIERISIFNLMRKTIIETNLEDVSTLTVDIDSDLIYWAESGEKIEYSSLEGDNRRVIFEASVLHPISIAVYDDFVYWIEKEQKVIERINKLSESGKQTVYNRLPQLTDIISVTKMDQNSTSLSCLSENGGCSHICLILHNEISRRCGCPKGLVLSIDERTCVSPPTCSPDQFACQSGKVNCIPNVWRCDGVPECEDKSDEMNCPNCLMETQFSCPRTAGEEPKCMENTLLCDGIPDCADGSDEHCCALDHFKCKTGGNCLTILQVCDGKDDCNDGSDENEKSCRDKRDRMPLEMTTPTPQRPTYGLVIFIAVCVLVIFGVMMAFQCRRKTNTNEEKEFNGANDLLMSTQRPLTSQTEVRNNGLLSGSENTIGKHVPIANFVCKTLQMNEQLFERNITGASSTSSSANHYPKETVNPPPSPVTDQSQCNFGSSSCASSVAHSRGSRNAILPNRHKKNSRYNLIRNRGPPPTPCTSEVYEDSEPSVKYTFYDNSNADLSYDSDPYPPPPTPRSGLYFSDLSGGPPSPSATERSFYNNPYPPPPSPVPESEAPEIT